jgi:hypothetical protein
MYWILKLVLTKYISEGFSETHTNGQVTQHGCLPNWLGDRDKRIEIVYVRKKKYFVQG